MSGAQARCRRCGSLFAPTERQRRRSDYLCRECHNADNRAWGARRAAARQAERERIGPDLLRGRPPGPAIGTEGICEGCGQTYIRNWRGQWFCTPRCYRLHGAWSPKNISWGPVHGDPDTWRVSP